ncbi:uncharacterized protein [Phyllobates terribilis]|uniref:uncharacterized protein n=1 Tax=Phyllobates terribilis TaxID=111132 RepID=UPI003CCB6CD2
MSPYCSVFLLLTLQKCVFCVRPCGAEKYVSALEGGNVILQVVEEEFEDISWVFNKVHIATTTPNSTIIIKSWNFKSKLYTENGSLGIAEISMADSGTFTASVFKKEDSCSQCYQLSVHSNFTNHDIQVHHNLTGDGGCFITCAVNKADVTITWSSLNTDYKEEASTLHLNRTRMNSSWVCTAANRVINISKIIEPGTLCYEEIVKSKIVRNLILVCATLVVLGAVLAFCLKKKIMTSSTCEKKTKHIPIIEDFQKENFYHEIALKEHPPVMKVEQRNKKAEEQKEKCILTTIYTTAKNTTMVPVNKEVTLDCVYSTIMDC